MTSRLEFPLQDLARAIQSGVVSLPFARARGQVQAVTPSAVTIGGLSNWLNLGSLVEIVTPGGSQAAEVIRLERDIALCKLYDDGVAIGLGFPVFPSGELLFYPDVSWKGRTIDSFARPVDGKGPVATGKRAMKLNATPPTAMSRSLVDIGIVTGVRAIDAFTPICRGQRIGVFAGSGVGKSSLLSMLCNTSAFDTVIISLVGERGREVREFVDVTLGKMAENAITIVATGDESAMMRRLAPLFATATAEFFRDQGHNVLFVMDSVTRYAHACREVALSAGEPPVARGYPPSVFSHLPQLLERTGPGAGGTGTITAIYAVLVDGDDHNDPVADSVRGTLDGHIVLDREIAEQGRFPAINLLTSLSRLAKRVWTADQARVVNDLKKLISRFEDTRDLRAMGGYIAGADSELDRAIELVPKLYEVLTQTLQEQPSSDVFRDIAAALS